MPDVAVVLAPVLLAKRAVITLQSTLQQLVWDELIHGKTVPNNVFQAGVFIAFCGFCLLSYLAHRSSIPLVLIGAALCGVERWLARYQYYQSQGAILTLEHSGKNYQWRLAYPNGKSDSKQFAPTQVKHIEISRRQVYVGLSGEPIALVWHIDLQLTDQSHLPIATEFNLEATLKKAKVISREFQIPPTFIDSESLTERHALAPSITCRSTNRGWQMITGWAMSDSWRLLGQSLDRAGLLLFAILFEQFAAQFGEFLVRLWRNWQDYGAIVIDISPLFQVFQTLNAWDWLGLVIAIAMLIWEGARLSGVKRLAFNGHTFQFKAPRQPPAKLSETVAGVVFLPQPTPLLAIWDNNNQVIEITDLPRLDDHREIGFQVTQTLSK